MISEKNKNLLVLFLKVAIIILAFYFIYSQLTKNDGFQWRNFEDQIKSKMSFWMVVLMFIFSVTNRFLEILKWKNLVSTIAPISIKEATKQVLAALTVGIVTPNGIGEYAGKALYFDKTKTKKIIFLNLICNGIQMFLTIIFGTIGLLFLGYWEWALAIIGLLILFIVFSILSKNIKVKGYSIKKLYKKINEIPKRIHQKNNLLALCRYVVFSHQYYFLFLAFDIDLPYFTMMATIATVYFLASSLPSFQVLDFAVKGSMAVFFFGKLGINEWIIIFITMLMWFLNVALPVLIGSIYVIRFKRYQN